MICDGCSESRQVGSIYYITIAVGMKEGRRNGGRYSKKRNEKEDGRIQIYYQEEGKQRNIDKKSFMNSMGKEREISFSQKKR